MFGLSIWDILVVGIYIFVILMLGWQSKKKVNSTGDYFMGNRRGSKIMMIANAIGAGTHTNQAVLVAGATYEIGLAGVWYQWFFLFATPFFWLIAPIYRRLRYITMADFFERRYGSKMGVLYAFMGLLFFTLNIGLLLKGTSTVLESITGGELSTVLIVLGLTVFFLAYSVLGGLVSALRINVLQGFFVVILSFLLIPFALFAGGGITEIKSSLPEYMFSFVAPKEVTLFFIVMVVLNGLVGVVVEPHHMAIGGAGKSELNCRTGWTYGNFVKRFATLGWAFIGVFAAALYPGLDHANREQAFGIAVSKLLPVGLLGLMISAMIAMVLGASHNFMVGGSALFTRNVYKKYIHKNSSDDKLLAVGRISSLIIVIGGVTIALTLSSVLEGIKFLWQITSFFGLSFWLGVMWKKANRIGAAASIIVMSIIAIVTGPWILKFPFEYQIALYLPAGFLVMIITSLLTKPESEVKLNEFYTLLHTPVGEEYKLKEKGIEILLEGQAEKSISLQNSDIALEDKGYGLLIVDLMSLYKKFNFNKYSIDLKGFGFAILFVLAILAFGIFSANIG
ncbi:MAG: sodium:solute symporter family protein [Ignavibacteriae bacterium]|nr:sodium:solute symporter family protein [Ignavibacteriota bacterium]